MAEEERIHGDPIHAGSSTGERPVEGTLRARLKVEFDLDLEEYGIPLIRGVHPPVRIAIQVARALFGEEAIAGLPPPPNDLRRLSPPTPPPAPAIPPSGGSEEKGGG